MTDQEIIDSTICRFKIIHQVSLKMAALDVVNGLRKCEHKNIKTNLRRPNTSKTCSDCGTLLTPSFICAIRDIREIKDHANR